MSASIPKTQKAVVFETHGGPLTYKDVPVPVPAADELLINVKYSGVCHTDLHAWKGDWPAPTKLPLIGGHEGAGVVVGMGSNVTGWKLGDHAGIKWLNSSCMTCEFCMGGHETVCPKQVISGYTHDGSFQQYATANFIHAAKLDPEIDLEKVAPVLCAGITVYKALKVSDCKAGDWVAITGAGGGLGSLAVQYAKIMGLRVVGIDTGEEKEKLVKTLGGEGTAFIDFMKYKGEDFNKAIVDATGGGPHAVVHVAVAEAAITASTEYIRPCGTIVLVGLPADAYVKSQVFSQVLKAVTIRGSIVGDRADTAEALEFFKRGLIKCPIKTVGLSELPEVYKLMQEGKVAGRYVLDTSK